MKKVRKAIALFLVCFMLSGFVFAIDNVAAQDLEEGLLFHYTFDDYNPGDGYVPGVSETFASLPLLPLPEPYSKMRSWSHNPNPKTVGFDLVKVEKNGRIGVRASYNEPKKTFSITNKLPLNQISHNYVVEISYLFETKSNVKVLSPVIDIAGNNSSPIMLYSRDDEFLIKTDVSNLSDIKVFVTDKERKRELDTWYDTILVSKEVRNESNEVVGANLSAYVNGKKFVEAYFPGSPTNSITQGINAVTFGVNEYYHEDATENAFMLDDYKMYTGFQDLEVVEEGITDGETGVSCESLNIVFNNKINLDTLDSIILKDSQGNKIDFIAENEEISENIYDLTSAIVKPLMPLDPFSEYTIDISNVEDLMEGRVNSEDAVITFTTTDREPIDESNDLEVTDNGIVDGAVDISCKGINVVLNNEINPDTLHNIRLTDKAGAIIPIDVTLGQNGDGTDNLTAINIVPKPWYNKFWYSYNLLNPLTNYTLSLYGVEDTLGGTFLYPKDSIVNFKTGDNEYNTWIRDFERSLYYDNNGKVEYDITAYAYPLMPKSSSVGVDVRVVAALYQGNKLKKVAFESQNSLFTQGPDSRVEVPLNTEGLDEGECVLKTFVFEGPDFESITPVDGAASWHKFYVSRNVEIYEGDSQLIGDFPESDLVAVGDTGSPFDFTNDTHETMHNLYDELMLSNPEYITKTLLGYDTITGKLPIYSYTFKPIRTVENNEALPVVALGGLIHGHENTAVYAMYHFFERICNEWEEDEVLEYLRHNIQFSVIPIQAPWEFNNKLYNDSSGVNTNRNFSLNWDLSVDPAKGPTPFSKNEARIIADFLEHTNPALHMDSHDRAGRQLVDDDRLMWFILPTDTHKPIIQSVVNKLSERWEEKYPNLTSLSGELTSYGKIERSDLKGGKLLGYASGVLGIPTFTWEGFSRVNGYDIADSKEITDMNADWYGQTLVELIRGIIVNK